MKKTKLFIVVLVSLLIISFNVFAEIPDKTVIIGDKAFDLIYVNDNSNYNEILEAIVNNKSSIYVKWNNIWYDDSIGKVVSKDNIGSVTYKDINGNITEYAAGDGDEINFKITEASFISDNKLCIKFNNKVDKSYALKKENYKINGKALLKEDKIILDKEEKMIIISLKNEIEDGNTNYSIEVAKEICDLDKNNLYDNYKKDMFVINKDNYIYTGDNRIDCDINLIGKNITIEDVYIKGDIYINNNGAFLNNARLSGTVYINPGDNGNTYITKSSFNNIKVLSGGKKSIHLKDVKTNSLSVDGNIGKLIRVVVKANSIIKNAELNSDVIFETIENSSIEKLNITPKSEKSIMQLNGNFKCVSINGKAQIQIVKGIIEKVSAKCDADIKTSKEAKISEIINNEHKINVVEDSKDDDNNTNTSSTSGSSNISDGGSTGNDTPVISEDTEAPYVKKAYITLADGTNRNIELIDKCRGKIDITDIGDEKIIDFTIELSENNCYMNILIRNNEVNIPLKKKLDGKIITLSSYSDELGEYDKGEKGISLYKLRQITDGDSMNISGILKDAAGNENNVSIELIVK